MNWIQKLKLRKIEKAIDRLPIDQEHHDETRQAVNTLCNEGNTTQRMALHITIKQPGEP
jgi:hypothetical protein